MSAESTTSSGPRSATPPIHKPMVGFMLAHEQFPVPELVQLGVAAEQAGFDLLATSVTIAGVSVPNFFLGLMLILVFSLVLRVFPPGGYAPAIDDLKPRKGMKQIAPIAGCCFCRIKLRSRRRSRRSCRAGSTAPLAPRRRPASTC